MSADAYYASYEIIVHDEPGFSAMEEAFFQEGERLAEQSAVVDDFADLEDTDRLSWRPRAHARLGTV